VGTVIDQFKGLSVFKEDSVFVAGEISGTWLEMNPSHMNANEAIRQAVVAKDDPFVRLAPLANMPVRSGDEVHLSGPGLVAGGKIIYDTWRGSVATAGAPAQYDWETYVFSGLTRLIHFDARDAIGDVGGNLVAWPERVSGLPVTLNGGGQMVETGAVRMNNGSRIGFTTGINQSQAFTVFAMVTFDAAQVTTNNQIIIYDEDGSDRVILYASGLSDGVGDLTANSGTLISNTGVNVAGGQLMAYAAVFNGASSVFYENGIPVLTGDPGANTFSGTLFMGNGSSDTHPSNIRLHTVILFEGILTPSQIAKLDRELRGFHPN